MISDRTSRPEPHATDVELAGADQRRDHEVAAELRDVATLLGVEAKRPRYAVRTPAALDRPSSSTATSRILNFWILPVTVIGNASTNFQWRGIL